MPALDFSPAKPKEVEVEAPKAEAPVQATAPKAPQP